MTISEKSYELLQDYWFLSADATENRAQRQVARGGEIPARQGHFGFVINYPEPSAPGLIFPVMAGLDSAIHAFVCFATIDQAWIVRFRGP